MATIPSDNLFISHHCSFICVDESWNGHFLIASFESTIVSTKSTTHCTLTSFTVSSIDYLRGAKLRPLLLCSIGDPHLIKFTNNSFSLLGNKQVINHGGTISSSIPYVSSGGGFRTSFASLGFSSAIGGKRRPCECTRRSS